MGYHIDLTTNQPVSVEDVESALIHLNALSSPPPRRAWGWDTLSLPKLEADILLPKGRTITVSGSWMTYRTGRAAAEKLASQLRTMGYQVEVQAP